MEINQYDIKSLTMTPKWPLIKEQSAAYSLIPILQDLGPDIRGIELGVCWGINSYVLLESCPNISLIVGIDHYAAYTDWDREIYQHEQDHNLAKLKNNMQYMGPRFTLIRESTTVAATELEDGFYDFVFIDADHSMKAVLNDLDRYYPKIRSGGVIAGHDSNLFSVNFAVTSWTRRHGISDDAVKSGPNSSWWWHKR